MSGTGRPEATPWRRLGTRPIYENPWIRVHEDSVARPDGSEGIYGVVTLAGAVGVLPFVDPDHVLLVGQWRYIVERWTWEMPTGGIHAGEPLEEAAQRELTEEVGVRAGRLERLPTFATSKSVIDEMATLFLGHDLTPASLPPDETEFLTVAPFAFDEVLQMVLDGDIIDAMTIIAVLLADRRRSAR